MNARRPKKSEISLGATQINLPKNLIQFIMFQKGINFGSELSN
jgi:hypothetical protein